MGTNRSPEVDTEDGATYCARHPSVETALACGRCGTLICPRCLVMTPVGARCPDCANVRKIPTVDVKPVFAVRGLLAALGAGAAVGAAWGYLLGSAGFFGFFTLFIAAGIGWAVGESVSVATNRKRGVTLQTCVVIGVVLAYFVHNIVAGDALLPRGDIWGYIATGVAAVVGMDRVRR